MTHTYNWDNERNGVSHKPCSSTEQYHLSLALKTSLGKVQPAQLMPDTDLHWVCEHIERAATVVLNSCCSTSVA